MLKFSQNINPLLSGIFLLIWSMSSYFIFGSTGRLLLQLFGFLLVVYAAYNTPNKKNLIKKSIISFLFFVIIILISLVNEQEVFDFHLRFGFF